MEKFKWAAAQNLEEAQEEINATSADIISGKKKDDATIIMAGGVDMLDLMKEGILKPAKVLSINSIPNLDKISISDSGIKIGALVKLSDIEHNEEIKKTYTALHEAVSHAATPQVRNMATMGGNLAQRPRCWYFRSEYHKCLKKGGTECFAKEGQNEIHAIYKTEICPCVHSSSVSTALVAFDASVEILDKNGKNKSVKLNDFFITPEVDVTRENILEPKEIITGITIPRPKSGTKSFYVKQAAKESYDWALADAAVVMECEGNTCGNAMVVMGAAAPVPLRMTEVEKYLKGQNLSESVAQEAGIIAVSDANPLSDNAYKVPMFQSVVKQCILKAV